ncbi:MAG: hypothetical protein ACHQ50_01665 [Fimbriimonadales bacterium]
MLRRILALFPVLVFALSSAQVRVVMPKPDKAPSAPYPVFLLGYPSVAKDLGLSATTVKKIDRIEKEAVKRHLAMISPTPSHPNSTRPMTPAQRQEEARKTSEAMLALLSPTAKARLRQIGLQYFGAYALADPTMSRSIQITPAQQSKLRDAANKRAKAFQQILAAITPTPHLAGSNPQDASRKISAAQVAKIRGLESDAAKILNRRQMQQWKRMQGRPFPIETLYAPVQAKVVTARS